MNQVAALVGMAVSNDEELWDYLSGLPAEMSHELAFRAALRALPEVAQHGALSEASAQYTLAACRAALTAGVLLRRPGDEALRQAAVQAAKASHGVRVFHNALVRHKAPAADAMVRVISALEAVYAGDAAAAADLAGHAMAHDVGCYDDCELEAEELATTPIELYAMASAGGHSQFASSEAWAFWRAWHEEALRGTPLPWNLQAEIARLPQDVWAAGPAVVAGRIGRIFARVELVTRIEALERHLSMEAPEDEDAGNEPAAAAGFAAVRLIREPMDELMAQAHSPKPQPYLIQKATARLSVVMAASGKWLGRSVEGDIKDMVRVIGKGGGVATATWIDAQAPFIRAMVRAADDWRYRLPS